jgi:hypothetical protein
MSEATKLSSSGLFNTPFETGVRSVILLNALYPNGLNLDRIVALDHFVVHTADVGGPSSLHPPAPTRAAEMLVRRSLVDRGLLIMIARGLVERRPEREGIIYTAGEEAGFFVGLLSSPYLLELKDRASWLAANIASLDDVQFRDLVQRQLDQWAIQFQPVQRIANGGGN